MTYTYVEAITKAFPNTQCHTVGDNDRYENLVWDGGQPLPSKALLDEWIANNPKKVSDKKITVLAFRNRFTVQEKVKSEMMSIDNPNLPMEQRQISATLRVILRDTDIANFIDLARADTIQGVHFFEQIGIIAPGRATEILENAVQDYEIPLVQT